MQCTIFTQHWAALWLCHPSTPHILMTPHHLWKEKCTPIYLIQEIHHAGFSQPLQYYLLFLKLFTYLCSTLAGTLSQNWLTLAYYLAFNHLSAWYTLSPFSTCKYPIHFSNVISSRKPYLFPTPNKKWAFLHLNTTVFCLYLSYNLWNILPFLRVIGSFDWSCTRPQTSQSGYYVSFYVYEAKSRVYAK